MNRQFFAFIGCNETIFALLKTCQITMAQQVDHDNKIIIDLHFLSECARKHMCK